MISLQARLTRLVCIAVIPLVLLVGTGLFVFIRTAIVSRFDDGLRARAQALVGMIKIEDAKLEFDFSAEAMPQYNRAADGEFFELWRLEGNEPRAVIQRSGSLGAADLPMKTPAAGPTIWDAPTPTGAAGRMVAVVCTPRVDSEAEHPTPPAQGEGGPVLIIVAQSRVEMDRTLRLFAGALGAAGVLLIGGTLGAVRIALRRGLRPVAKLASGVAALGPDDLSGRLSYATPTELRPIVERTNQLLDRLSAAFDREKRLASSAAHELRTPIAEVRAVAELALSRDRDSAALRHALEQVVEVSQRMGQSADAVLRLARVQAGREKPNLKSVNLRDVLGPVWDRRIGPLNARGVHSSMNVPPDFTVRADAAMLGVMLDNILANAAEHTPRGGTVRAEVNEQANLCVTNTIGESDVPGVEQPIHAGLGLRTALAMAEAHGGSCDAQLVSDRFVVSLRLLQDS